jgi:four helix bundle protein
VKQEVDRRKLDRWKNLEVWRRADEFAHAVYSATSRFPPEERFGLTAQLRRASLSIPTNIVEGYSRKGDRELSRFTDIALGSLAESRYLLMFARQEKILADADFEQLMTKADELGAKLWNFSTVVRPDRAS